MRRCSTRRPSRAIPSDNSPRYIRCLVRIQAIPRTSLIADRISSFSPSSPSSYRCSSDYSCLCDGGCSSILAGNRPSLLLAGVNLAGPPCPADLLRPPSFMRLWLRFQNYLYSTKSEHHVLITKNKKEFFFYFLFSFLKIG